MRIQLIIFGRCEFLGVGFNSATSQYNVVVVHQQKYHEFLHNYREEYIYGTKRGI